MLLASVRDRGLPSISSHPRDLASILSPALSGSGDLPGGQAPEASVLGNAPSPSPHMPLDVATSAWSCDRCRAGAKPRAWRGPERSRTPGRVGN